MSTCVDKRKSQQEKKPAGEEGAMNRAPTWLRLVSAQADNGTSKDLEFIPGLLQEV